MTTIVAINQTGSPVSLSQLSVPDGVIPATGSIATLTDFNTISEIQSDPQLLGYVQGGTVLLNDGETTLTQAESLRMLSSVVFGVGSADIGRVMVYDGSTGTLTGSTLTINANGDAVLSSGAFSGPFSGSRMQVTHLTASFVSASLIELKQTSSVGHSEGTMYYDLNEHALTVMNDEVDVRHQLGQEGFVRVRNESGGTITNGSVVYISGSGGGELRPSIALALSNDAVTSEVIGLATHDIENNSYGYVTIWGKVNDLDTSAFADGDTLRLSDSTPGGLINTNPITGSYNVLVGYVIHSSATTGSIFVQVNADLGAQAGDASELVDDARKASPGTINPGQVVYVAGWNNGLAIEEVELAQANAAGTMPAVGVARDTITNNTIGKVVAFGRLSGLNTSGYSVGQALYVSGDTAGALTSLKPSGSNAVQKVALVVRTSANNGVIDIIGSGRANDLPTLATDNVWLGNSGSTPTATARSGIDDTAIHDNVSSEISAITAKAAPVANDYLIIEDSAAGNVKKHVLWGKITGSGGALVAHGLADATYHTASTLAELNTKISDATLDTNTAERPAAAHGFADVTRHSASTLAQVNTLISDATLIDTADSRLSDDRNANPHGFAGASRHSASTLAEVNTLISDATLDTNTAARPASPHGFADVVRHSASVLAEVNALISDATLIDTNDSRLSDDRNPVIHGLGSVARHSASTLAELNALVSDATLDTNTAARPASPHGFADVTRHSASTLAQVNTLISDATLIDTADSRLSNDRDPNIHGLGNASRHSASTLAELNILVSDATLDTNTAERPAAKHGFAGASRHSASTLAQVNALISDATLIDDNDPRLTDNRYDNDAIHTLGAGEISSLTEKTAMVAQDIFVIESSENSYAKRYIQLGNLTGSSSVSGTGSAGQVTYWESTSVLTGSNIVSIGPDGLVVTGTIRHSGSSGIIPFGNRVTNLGGPANHYGTAYIGTLEDTGGSMILATDLVPQNDSVQTIGSPSKGLARIHVQRISSSTAAEAIQLETSIYPSSDDTVFLGQAGFGFRSALIKDVTSSFVAFRFTGSSPTDVAGYGKLFVKSSDGDLWYRDQIGTETNLTDGATDNNAIHDNVASEISVVTTKGVPVAGDFLLIEDSAAANVKKKVLWGTITGSGGTSVAGDMPVVQARRTTSYAVSSSWADVNFDATDVQNDSSSLKHDVGGNPDNILISSTGPCWISYHANMHFPDNGDTVIEGQARVRIDDADFLTGSDAQSTVLKDASLVGENVTNTIGKGFLANLTSGSFVTLQIQSALVGGTDGFYVEDATFSVIRLTGEKGDTGPSGSSGTGSMSAHGLADAQYHTASTLAELNTKISDATLDTNTAERPAAAHGFADVVRHTASVLSEVNSLISDATLIDTADSRLSDDRNPVIHGLGSVSRHSASTLAELNALISDATLDTNTAFRTDDTAIHDNIASELSAVTVKGTPVAGDFLLIEDSAAGNVKKSVLWGTITGSGGAMSAHGLADAQYHTASTLAELNTKVSDATLIDTGDSRLSDDRNPVIHGLGSAARHSASTLAELNTLVSDATLDTNTAARPASPHGFADVVRHSASVLSEVNALISDATLIDTADSRLSDDRNANPHGFAGASRHSASTLAEVNALISDATLDTNTAFRTDDVAIHDNVASEISVIAAKGTPVAGDFLLIEDSAAGNVKKSVLWGTITGSGGAMSPHGLADALYHTASTLAELNTKISDATLIDTADSRLSDDRNANPHGFAGASRHTASTLAEVNALVSDATLIDTADSRLSDDRNPVIHGLGSVARHSASTLAELNALISDATLDTNTAFRTDDTAIHDNIASEISVITAKATPIAGDFLLIEDSAAANVKKRVLIGSITGSSKNKEQTKSITITNPGTTENVAMFYTVDPITINYLAAVVSGSAPSRTWNVAHNTSRATAGNLVMSASVTTTSTTTGNKVNTFTSGDPTVPADSWVTLRITAGSGTVTEFHLSIRYVKD